MKSILSPSFDYTPGAATDIRKTFERAWRELAERQDSEADDGTNCSNVWLECNGELVDSNSVKILRRRRSVLGLKVVDFLCPRCNERHESLRFG